MSAYGHEMEREYSARSFFARGGSEMGSRYTTEAGIYMSSCAAMILISGLVTFLISITSLVVALTVMLNSCQSTNDGALQMLKSRQSYDYCRNFALHAELNSLSAEHYPATCKDIEIQYMKEGQYRKDLNITVAIAEDYFSSIRPQIDGRDVMLMDADDFLVSETFHAYPMIYRINNDALHDTSREANYLKHVFAVKLCVKLVSDKWQLILYSRKPEKLRNATVEYLISVGCHGWSSLITRMDNEVEMDFQEYLSRQRCMLQREGFPIVSVISSQMDALRGPCLGERIFKLPNSIFRYNIEDYHENKIEKRKLLKQSEAHLRSIYKRPFKYRLY